MTTTNIGSCGCCGSSPAPTITQVWLHSVASSGLCSLTYQDCYYDQNLNAYFGGWFYYGSGTVTVGLRVLWSDQSETYVTDVQPLSNYGYEMNVPGVGVHQILNSPRDTDGWTALHKLYRSTIYPGITPQGVTYVVGGRTWKIVAGNSQYNNFYPLFITDRPLNTVADDCVSLELTGTWNAAGRLKEVV